jgi:hypothetical protein
MHDCGALLDEFEDGAFAKLGVPELERVLVDGGELYFSFLFPKALTKRERLFVTARHPLNRAGRRLCKIATVYYYLSFNKPSFIKACRPNSHGSFRNIGFEAKRRLFGDNIGFIFSKQGDVSSKRVPFLSGLRQKLESALDMRLSDSELIRIGSGGSVVIDFGKVIVRMPQNHFGQERCNRNFSTLQRLCSFHLSLKTPNALLRGSLAHQSYFVESKIPGKSLDLNPSVGRFYTYLERQAYRFISNKELKVGVIDENSFDHLVKREFECINPWVRKPDRDILNRLLDTIHSRILSGHVPTVIQHGDFKKSNFLVSRLFPFRLTAVIDWDMGAVPGLPLVDLLSLLTAGRQLPNPSIPQAIWSLIAAKQYDPFIADYLQRMGISVANAKLLGLLAIIRYLNHFYYDPEIKKDQSWYDRFIRDCVLPASQYCLSEKAPPHA